MLATPTLKEGGRGTAGSWDLDQNFRRWFLMTRVSVTDINMPFGSMVVFMVKWALAAIPAALILVVIFFVAGAVFGALGGGVFGGVR